MKSSFWAGKIAISTGIFPSPRGRRAAPQLKDVAKVFANCGAFAGARADDFLACHHPPFKYIT